MRRSLTAATAILVLHVLPMQLIARAVAADFSAAAERTGNISVLFQDELDPAAIEQFEARYEVTAMRPILDRALISFTSATDTDDILATIREDPAVAAASEITRLRRQQAIDPLFPDQWWLANTGQEFFVGIVHFILSATGFHEIWTEFPAMAGNDIRWLQARALNACGGVACSGEGVTVAVVDTGIDASHPDLAGQVSPLSVSFDASDSSTDDVEGHGTFIAGLIAARNDNGGIIGVAPAAQILAIKDDLTSDSISRSIRYAAEHGAGVINLSLGGPSPNEVMRAAITYATQAPYNAIVVASAGNDGLNGNPVLYPASFSGVVSVGSVDPDGMHSLFSEWNSFVDVAAPGGFVTSLKARNSLASTDCTQNATALSPVISYLGVFDCVFTEGKTIFDGLNANGVYYTNESGTSFSAPLVAAGAALAKEKWPTITSEQFEQLIHATARLAPGQLAPDEFYGAGTLDLQRLLTFNFPPDLPQANVALTQAAVTNSGADTTQVVARVVDLDGSGDVSSVTAQARALGWVDLPLTRGGDGTFSSAVLTIPVNVSPNQYPITITARDTAGGQATASLTLVVAAAGTLPPSGLAGSSADVTVTISRPARRRELLTRKKSIAVSGETAVGAAFIEVNGSPAEVDAARHAWSATVPLEEGKNDIHVRSMDVTRMVSGDARVTVTRDTRAPGPVRSLHAEAQGGSTKLIWTAPVDKDLSGYHVYRASDRKTVEIAGTGTTSAVVPGTGTFLVTAEDKAGNEGAIDKAPSVKGAAASATFSDVPPSHFAAGAVARLASRGVVGGQNGMFRPDAVVTRAEFAKMLAGVRGVSASTAGSRFADVPASDPLAIFIEAIAARGWATGDGKNYHPSAVVLRIEAAAMIARAMGYQNGRATFRDVTGDDAKVAAAVADARIASGQQGLFYPRRPLTRGEAAKMLAAIL